jgi:hypothetical protein
MCSYHSQIFGFVLTCESCEEQRYLYRFAVGMTLLRFLHVRHQSITFSSCLQACQQNVLNVTFWTMVSVDNVAIRVRI